MSSIATVSPSIKTGRSLRITRRYDDGTLLLLVCDRGDFSFYELKPMEQPFDGEDADLQTFRFLKRNPSGQACAEYDVLWSPHSKNDWSCECPGHLHWGHKTVCRHLSIISTLKARNLI